MPPPREALFVKLLWPLVFSASLQAKEAYFQQVLDIIDYRHPSRTSSLLVQCIQPKSTGNRCRVVHLTSGFSVLINNSTSVQFHMCDKVSWLQCHDMFSILLSMQNLATPSMYDHGCNIIACIAGSGGYSHLMQQYRNSEIVAWYLLVRFYIYFCMHSIIYQELFLATERWKTTLWTTIFAR